MFFYVIFFSASHYYKKNKDFCGPYEIRDSFSYQDSRFFRIFVMPSQNIYTSARGFRVYIEL